MLLGEATARVQRDISGELFIGVAGLESLRTEDQRQVHEQWETGKIVGLRL